MGKKVNAIYENGVLRPLESLGLAERERMAVIVYSSHEEDWVGVEDVHLSAAWADESARLEAMRGVLKKIPASLTTDIIAE
jgi:predicted DNA-binding antitoxin AbrB/MazE fold protein